MVHLCTYLATQSIKICLSNSLTDRGGRCAQAGAVHFLYLINCSFHVETAVLHWWHNQLELNGIGIVQYHLYFYALMSAESESQFILIAMLFVLYTDS